LENKSTSSENNKDFKKKSRKARRDEKERLMLELEKQKEEMEKMRKKAEMENQRYAILDRALKDAQQKERSERQVAAKRRTETLSRLQTLVSEINVHGNGNEDFDFVKAGLSRIADIISDDTAKKTSHPPSTPVSRSNDDQETTITRQQMPSNLRVERLKMESGAVTTSTKKKKKHKYFSSPVVRKLRMELEEQKGRAEVLEEALSSVKSDQKDLNGFQEIERTTLEQRVAQLQNALAQTTDSTSISPRKLRVRVPDDVAAIVSKTNLCEKDIHVVVDEEEEEEEEKESDVVEHLNKELEEVKAHTQKQRESLEAQLEELTAELQEHMERDESEMTEERVRAKELQEKLERSEAALQSARAQQLELKSSEEMLRKRLEEVSLSESNSEMKQVLNSQLDELCDIVEKQETEIESSKRSGEELRRTKRELEDMQAYILAYKTRSDEKIQALKEEIESGNDEIAALDTRMLQVQRMLQEIVRRGESGKMKLKKILSTLTKMSESLVRRDDE